MYQTLKKYWLIFFIIGLSRLQAIEEKSTHKQKLQTEIAILKKDNVKWQKTHLTASFCCLSLLVGVNLYLQGLITNKWILIGAIILCEFLLSTVFFCLYISWKKDFLAQLKIITLLKNKKASILASITSIKNLMPEHIAFIFDFVLVLILLLGAYRGYQIGFVSQLFSIFSLCVFLVLGINFFEDLVNFLQNQLPNLEGSAHFLGFFILFISFLILVFLLDRLVHHVMRMSMVGYVDSLLGSIVGIFQIACFLSTMIMALKIVGLEVPAKYSQHMYVYSFFQQVSPYIAHIGGKLIPSTSSIFLQHADFLPTR